MLDFFDLKYKAFGLEITDSQVRVAQFRKRTGAPADLVTRCVPLAKGAIKDGEIKNRESLVAAIRRATAVLKNEKKISGKYVIASLPENKAFLEVIQMPRLSSHDLRSAVIFEAENYIPLPIEKVYLDFEIIENSPAPADHLDILLVAMPRTVVDSYANAIKAAGLKPLAFEPESQAVIRTVLSGKPVLNGSLMITQIGDSRSNLIIYAAGSPRFTFSIPISNRYFLDTIIKFLKVSEEQAENLKKTLGISTQVFDRGVSGDAKKDSGQGKKIFEAMVPGLVDFVQQATKCLEYYKDHAAHEHGLGGEGRIGKVLLCGSGADLKDLDGFISLKLNVPVIDGRQVLVVGDTSKKNGIEAINKYSGDFVVAAGLALRATTEGEQIKAL